MNPIQLLILVLIPVCATGVVLVREPLSQTLVFGFYGILLSTLFFVFQAPDVALSQMVVGAVLLPLMILLTLGRINRNEREKSSEDDKTERAA